MPADPGVARLLVEPGTAGSTPAAVDIDETATDLALAAGGMEVAAEGSELAEDAAGGPPGVPVAAAPVEGRPDPARPGATTGGSDPARPGAATGRRGGRDPAPPDADPVVGPGGASGTGAVGRAIDVDPEPGEGAGNPEAPGPEVGPIVRAVGTGRSAARDIGSGSRRTTAGGRRPPVHARRMVGTPAGADGARLSSRGLDRAVADAAAGSSAAGPVVRADRGAVRPLTGTIGSTVDGRAGVLPDDCPGGPARPSGWGRRGGVRRVPALSMGPAADTSGTRLTRTT